MFFNDVQICAKWEHGALSIGGGPAVHLSNLSPHGTVTNATTERASPNAKPPPPHPPSRRPHQTLLCLTPSYIMSALAFSIISPSSPLWYISIMMSLPPINSPAT